MVVVHEEYRGIGTDLVRAVMGENKEMTWVLRAGRGGVNSFYEKLRFSLSEVAI